MKSARIKFAVELFTLNIVLCIAFHLRTYLHEPFAAAAYAFFWECLVQSIFVTVVIVFFIDMLRRRQNKE